MNSGENNNINKSKHAKFDISSKKKMINLQNNQVAFLIGLIVECVGSVAVNGYSKKWETKNDFGRISFKTIIGSNGNTIINVSGEVNKDSNGEIVNSYVVTYFMRIYVANKLLLDKLSALSVKFKSELHSCGKIGNFIYHHMVF